MSLIVDRVSFAYKDKKKKTLTPVLRDFSAEFGAGVITAVTGPNGAGKTTLTKVILGIFKADSGKITLDGLDMSGLSLAEAGRSIGYVMQNPGRQIFCTTVREEMEYGLKNIGLAQDAIDERTRHFLEYFGISQYEETFPFSLSQGEKQRLVLAAILAMEPKYLILDEPTAALDIKRKAVLGEYLKKISRDMDCGILLVSHDKGFVEKYADKEVVLTPLKETSKDTARDTETVDLEED